MMTESTTFKITVQHASHLNRTWPSSIVAIALLLVGGNMLVYPLWCLLLSKYREERGSLLVIVDDSNVVVWFLDALSQTILETTPRLVTGLSLLYIGICAGCVGIALLND